jgi:hypothetical protein
MQICVVRKCVESVVAMKLRLLTTRPTKVRVAANRQGSPPLLACSTSWQRVDTSIASAIVLKLFEDPSVENRPPHSPPARKPSRLVRLSVLPSNPPPFPPLRLSGAENATSTLRRRSPPAPSYCQRPAATMGVPKFFRWMSERYPGISQLIAENRIPEFDCLYVRGVTVLTWPS